EVESYTQGMAVSRRTVTVVFADVADSTPLGERLDPESLRRVMSRYFERMGAVLERHGGTVEKFIGDAVMAVFGLPELHEDDALRAVRAATELREALAKLNEELEPQLGVRIGIRVGVNTGEVVAGNVLAVIEGASAYARRFDTRLVGREAELRALHDAFAVAVAQRTCRLVTIVGPAGIGKSRLAAELCAEIGDRAQILSGRCLPY